MRYCLLFLSATLFLFSCKKTEVPKSNQELLRDGKWAITKVSVAYHKPGADEDSVYVIDRKDCELDNRIIFRAGTEGGHTTGDERCGAELDEYQFTWGITENDTKMYFYGAESFLGDDVNAKLEKFSSQEFVIVYDRYLLKENPFGMDTSEYTVTFKKK